jgi:transcriptional regulator with XRE-family HTH domain
MSEKDESGALPRRAAVGLTINQVVAYNLARIRRARGYTQDEAAGMLEKASGKKWTAATLSAAERTVKTGRSRFFDANEIATFARVFSVPVPYFFMPVEPAAKDMDIAYLQARASGEDGPLEAMTEPLLDERMLLHLAVPLRYPNEMVDQANRILHKYGVTWSPDAHVELWDEGEEAYNDWLVEEYEKEHPDELPVKDMATIVEFASLMKKHKSHHILRALAEIMEEKEARGGKRDEPLEDPPF